MIFLIQYNRSEGRVVALQSFDDSQRQQAENSRLELELELNRKAVDHEVVLLEAANEAALHQTHGRYFENLRQILSRRTGISDFASNPPSGSVSSDTASGR
jgi:hypothetical protein